MQKSMDEKLARILADPSCGDFILADAKDADMAFGLASAGASPEQHGGEARFRTMADYRQNMRELVEQGLLDIMLMSASSNEVLTIQERLFDGSHITPAVRANDTTDIWLAGGTGRYPQKPSRPFRTATIDHIMCGKVRCEAGERRVGADLGLYSMTFNNDVGLDLASLEHYRAFRHEAETAGFRHFLEVFDPNAPQGEIKDVGRFVADNIARALAGVTSAGRPLFLKIAYHGPAAMEALASYDRTMIPGILGGSAGTTLDAFGLLADAKKYGARVALFGRKINNAEHQPSFVKQLRAVADGAVGAVEAVKAYHGDLQGLGIAPKRSLDDDLKTGEAASAYSGGGSSAANQGGRGAAGLKTANSVDSRGQPDFSNMTPAEKVAWQRSRWDRILG
ncbi:MAG: hypothetical protein CMJ49_11655 [Planctomycetaceae bacterium]|nr:hypothetical protein [Planctomycetaceae bacterium]